MKFFKFIGFLAIMILGFSSTLFTGATEEYILVNIGPNVTREILLAEALVIAYSGAFLMFWSSWWRWSRGFLWFLGIFSAIFFGLFLNNASLFMWFKPPVYILSAPVLAYLFAALRFFERIARGASRAYLFRS